LPNKKIRREQPWFDAGGGGINVSKAISSLVASHCFTFGGPTGENDKRLVDWDEGIDIDPTVQPDQREF
jgi:6-phosphofructokinase 2